MTSSRAQKTVTLNLATVRTILVNLGHEEEDVQSFWRLALRENRDPGCLKRKNDAYWQKMMAQL